MTDKNQNIVTVNREFLIKQSEMLQGIITRMANSSLTVKQVGIGIWSALVGFGFTHKVRPLFVLALISFVMFGLLDIYYLLLERRFRDNFNRLARVIMGFEPETPQLMIRLKGNFLKPDKISRLQALKQYLDAFKSWANLPYLVIILITLIILTQPLPN
ncbi:MAG: hypothetical protein KME11_14375 [Timaviella obliquedivisa GSE-PSE-MK23-08B]|jgi:hypothetical protein|nr:hypothetical protein [Timaviella obliquedivisa GSE-PSE-MK23-08B]